jgi:DNA helicase-2/ATP-dependent DNA helicase PcrA
VPKRGLADATLSVLHSHARGAKVPLMEAARFIVETDELKPKPRGSLRDLLISFGRWSKLAETQPHAEVAQTVLEESGYTDMWQKERSADAAGRLENLKELVRAMEEFPDLQAFLEHIALVMDMGDGDGAEKVTLMTVHAAKGSEYDTVFLPGWEEGLFPNPRALDESGKAGLEEERRLAHVALTRARKRAKIYFASNRRIHGMWNSTIPSRFIDELPEDSVEVLEAPANFSYGGYGSRFDRMTPFGSSYQTPGWQRAQQNTAAGGHAFGGSFGSGTSTRGQSPRRNGPTLIEGELVAKSSGGSAYTTDTRVLHTKFGPGTVVAVDGNKLTVEFDKAGRKMVLDSFVERVG